MFKNKKITGVISALIAILMTVCIVTVGGAFAYGDDTVVINEINFPDETWRTIIKEKYSSDGKVLTKEDVAGVTFISVSADARAVFGEDADVQIANIKGIEKLTDLKTLRCGYVGLETLDVSAMPQLTELTCEGNELTDINLTNNQALKIFNCAGNEFETINVSNLTGLTRFECYANHLTALDVSALKALETLSCFNNQLTALDVSQNTALTSLKCARNHLTSLDLSANTALKNITNYNIGSQTVDAKALIDNGYYTVNININNYENIVSSNADHIEDVGGVDVVISGYDGQGFITSDFSAIKNGIDYYYKTTDAQSENMHVHINAQRDFHQVNYYMDAQMTELIDSQIINTGENSTPPQITPPMCKAFVNWSESTDNIQEDKDVYAVFEDAHKYAITSFTNNIVTITCKTCGDTFTVDFERIADSRPGDEGYVDIIDYNNDNIINGIDYAYLLKNYK